MIPAMAHAAPASATATPRKTPPLLAAVLLVVSLAYPVVVYLALGHVSPRWIALLLVALALARAWVTRESFWLVAAALATVLAGASFLGDRWGPLKLYPALVNAVMFGLFAMSLWRGPSVVERLARLRETRLPAGRDRLHAARHAGVVRVLRRQRPDRRSDRVVGQRGRLGAVQRPAVVRCDGRADGRRVAGAAPRPRPHRRRGSSRSGQWLTRPAGAR